MMRERQSTRYARTRSQAICWATSVRYKTGILGAAFLALMLVASVLPAQPADNSIGGDFELIDHYGQPFALQEARGRVVVLTFGYTFCPDVCPMALSNIAAALEQIGSPADDVLVLFVTLDPDRDTPEHLRRYVRFFHPQIVGLTGTEEALQAVADQYRVKYSFVGKGTRTDYSLDHTANIYILDQGGTLARMIPHGLPTEIMVRTLRSILDNENQTRSD